MRTYLRGKFTLLFMTCGLLLAIPAIALADNIQDNVTDNVTSALQLTAGDANSKPTAEVRIIGNNAQQDPDAGCNFDTATESLTIKFNTPTGVTATALDGATATPGEMKFTACAVDQTVEFSASSSAPAGDYTVTANIVTNGTNGTFVNQVSIPIKVSPPPDTTAPTSTASATVPNGTGTSPYNSGDWTNKDVTVTLSANDGGSGVKEIRYTTNGSDPSASSTLYSAPFTVSSTTTVKFRAYDNAGNAEAVNTFQANIDKVAPTITASRTPANANGWNNSDVTVSYTCADSLSGVDSCPANDTVSTEGANQSVTGNVTDKAGNTATKTVSDINIDLTDPSVALVGGPANGSEHYFGSVPSAPTCSASDALSGLNGACSVSGYGTTVGTHTVTATANDKAANTNTASNTYKVLGWTLKGFFSPVDYDANGTTVWNTVKGGSTVPLKFEVFAGSTELTDPSVVDKFTATAVKCPSGFLTTDEIEILSTGGTTLRYDGTGGQFIQNWQTPKKSGACYDVTMTTDDGTSLPVAHFQLK
jgi:hypothetical protein